MSSNDGRQDDKSPQQGLARRAFLRGAVGAGGVAIVSLLAACGGQAAGTAGTSGSATTGSASVSSAPSSSASSAAATTSASSSASSSPSASATTSSATSSSAAATTSASTSSAASAAATGSAATRTDITKMPDNQTLRINLGGEPDKIDPNLAEFTNEIAVVRQVFDALVLLDKDLKPIAGGAASWTTSSDGLTWTFKIRDHKYSDGTPVKAQDYEFSFKRILDPTVAAPYASYFAGVIKGSMAYNSALIAPPKAAAAGDYIMGAMIAQAATTTSTTGSGTASGSESTSSSASGSTTASGTESSSTTSSGTASASTTESSSAAASTSAGSTTAGSTTAGSTTAGSTTAGSSSAAATTAATSSAAASTPNANATVTPDQLKALRDAVGVKATDDSTLVITLEQPAGFFLDLVSLAVVPPLRQDLVSANWTTDLKKYIGDGPFAMIEHLPQDHMLFAPNPNYWGGAPKIGLYYYMVTDNNADFAAYRNGEREINVPPQNDVPSIKSDPQLSKEFTTNPTLLVYWLQYEMKHPPLDNQKFRYALSMAYDRESYVKDQLKGLGVPTTGFIPKGMPGYIADSGSAYAFDAAKAKQMFQESGVSVAAANKLSVLFTDTPVNAQHFSYVQALWKKYLGIQIQLRPQEPKARVAAQKAHNFDLVATGWSADYPDPQDWYDIFRTGDGNNQGEYSNKQYDALVKQADSEQDATKRLDLYAQADKILQTDQPALIQYQAIAFALVKPYVQNFIWTAQDEIPGDYNYKGITLASH